MLKKYKLLFIFLSAGIITLQSCGKDYFDLNDNPNQVITPTLGTLLTPQHIKQVLTVIM